MVCSSSFESPMNYPFAIHLIKKVAAILSHVILAQNNSIYVVLFVIRGCIFDLGTVFQFHT